jgi:hypothetical protein
MGGDKLENPVNQVTQQSNTNNLEMEEVVVNSTLGSLDINKEKNQKDTFNSKSEDELRQILDSLLTDLKSSLAQSKNQGKNQDQQYIINHQKKVESLKVELLIEEISNTLKTSSPFAKNTTKSQNTLISLIMKVNENVAYKKLAEIYQQEDIGMNPLNTNPSEKNTGSSNNKSFNSSSTFKDKRAGAGANVEFSPTSSSNGVEPSIPKNDDFNSIFQITKKEWHCNVESNTNKIPEGAHFVIKHTNTKSKLHILEHDITVTKEGVVTAKVGSDETTMKYMAEAMIVAYMKAGGNLDNMKIKGAAEGTRIYTIIDGLKETYKSQRPAISLVDTSETAPSDKSILR